jgi:hypothetical protein
MNEDMVDEFISAIQQLCYNVGAWCDVSKKNRPNLEHVKIEISFQVKPKGLKPGER